MPKPPTFPPLYDEVLNLDRAVLKREGFLEAGTIKTGILTWNREGEKLASISIQSNTTIEPAFIELNYNYNGEPLNYTITLRKFTNSLGLRIYYLVCPKSGKRARKLYLIDGYFIHREAVKGWMYASQTRSKRTREFHKGMDVIFKAEEIPEKWFRPYYRGKPTKTLKRLRKRQAKLKVIDVGELFQKY